MHDEIGLVKCQHRTSSRRAANVSIPSKAPNNFLAWVARINDYIEFMGSLQHRRRWAYKFGLTRYAIPFVTF